MKDADVALQSGAHVFCVKNFQRDKRPWHFLPENLSKVALPGAGQGNPSRSPSASVEGWVIHSVSFGQLPSPQNAAAADLSRSRWGKVRFLIFPSALCAVKES